MSVTVTLIFMIELENITMPADQFKQMLTILQSIRRKAENRGEVELIELADRCAKLAEDALKRETT